MSPRHGRRTPRALTAIALIALLAACGGGKEGENASGDGGGTAGRNTAQFPAEDAARFLTQASYGPTPAEIEAVRIKGYAGWIEEQFAKPQVRHRDYMDQMAGDLAATGGSLSQTHFRESYWAQALAGEDQLRQRAAFALSEIFVVSFADANLQSQLRGVAGYYDLLGEKAFGNFRDLLEGVARHPMMGMYLTSLKNQKEDEATGRVPDENFAREVMQLFTIGLYELNNDGTTKGATPVDTYSHDDIKGLAKVFTGFSWYAGESASDRTDARFSGGNAVLGRDWRPMQAYAKFHSTSEKKFLGTTIAASGSADADADLKQALDRLFQHANVGPFIGRQLIQRLVTSNPSPGYVDRVASAFNNNGAGVRGDMKAVFRAILLDSEARSPNLASPSYGKLREPILRLSSLLRAFNARSTNGRFTGIDDTDNIAQSLGQTVMKAPSVFNFFRPGYVPPNSAAATANLVAPEMQLTNEVSVAGYLNFVRNWLTLPSTPRDIQLDLSKEIALADDPGALVDRVDLLLMSGQMSNELRDAIVAAVKSRTVPAATATNEAQVNTAKRDRVNIAIMLTMASPDYLIQK